MEKILTDEEIEAERLAEQKKQELIDFEKWGRIKRHGDINFCRRLRKMRKDGASWKCKVSD